MVILNSPNEYVILRLHQSHPEAVVHVRVAFMYHQLFKNVQGNSQFILTNGHPLQKILYGPDTISGEAVEIVSMILHNPSIKNAVVGLDIAGVMPRALEQQVPPNGNAMNGQPLQFALFKLDKGATRLWKAGIGWQSFDE